MACGSGPAEQEPERAETPAADHGRVRWYEPSEAQSGFNLFLVDRRIPTIVDMNGRVVHSWPDARAKGRIRLKPDGRLTVLTLDEGVHEYSWEGELLRRIAVPEGTFTHHDVAILASGNHLFLLGAEPSDDRLHEVDAQDRVVWQWRLNDHRGEFEAWDDDSGDPSHVNSIREIPANRWFDAGDDRFRPGNILVSARNLNTIFIVDKPSGDVVWKYSAGLDRQHEAVFIAEPHLHAGKVLVFNNGLEDRYGDRRSRVEIIDPIAAEVVWHYEDDRFFSSTSGVAHPLAPGNVFVASSAGDRTFELTPDRQIVWEWETPFSPMRPERLPYDYTPQLERLRPDEVAVTPADYEPYPSRELSMFDEPDDVCSARSQGKMKHTLKRRNQCRRMFLRRAGASWDFWSSGWISPRWKAPSKGTAPSRGTFAFV